MTRRTGVKILSVVTAALLTGAVAAAQQNGTGTMQENPPGQQEPGLGVPGFSDESGGGVPGGADSMARSFAEEAFVLCTLERSAAEMQMSLLAEEKSPSPDVKKYGLRMVQIHTELVNQLTPIARMLGVRAHQQPTRKEKHWIAHLKTLSGPAFNHAYIRAMAITQWHDLRAFRDASIAAQSATVKQAAKMDMPMLRRHLVALHRLAQSHNVMLATK
jgi:putative membrane protein